METAVAFCTREKVEKPISAFSPSQIRKTGRGWCRECFNEIRPSTVKGRRPKESPPRQCALPGCEVDLSHRRAHARYCSSAHNAKAWRFEHPGAQRDYWIKCVYGLTPEEFDAILESQGGGCAICGKVVEMDHRVRTEQWNVDHCHATDAVCGILCSPCNIGIGQLADDPLRITAALDYVLRTRGIAPHRAGELLAAIDIARQLTLVA